MHPHFVPDQDISDRLSPPTCSRKIDLDGVIEPGHEFNHGATCRAEHRDGRHDKPALGAICNRLAN